MTRLDEIEAYWKRLGGRKAILENADLRALVEVAREALAVREADTRASETDPDGDLPNWDAAMQDRDEALRRMFAALAPLVGEGSGE
jgi:hypothetical protein